MSLIGQFADYYMTKHKWFPYQEVKFVVQDGYFYQDGGQSFVIEPEWLAYLTERQTQSISKISALRLTKALANFFTRHIRVVWPSVSIKRSGTCITIQ